MALSATNLIKAENGASRNCGFYLIRLLGVTSSRELSVNRLIYLNEVSAGVVENGELDPSTLNRVLCEPNSQGKKTIVVSEIKDGRRPQADQLS